MEGLEDLSKVAAKLEPLLEQVQQQATSLAATQEALEALIEENKGLREGLVAQETTFIWLLAEVSGKPLDEVEGRYAQGRRTLREKQV